MPQSSPLIFGEVLFDCFPDGRKVLGGAPFNVAWNLQAFGCRPLFMSRVGEDREGRRIRDAMTAWGMDTTLLQTDASRPTGRVEITLVDGEPRFTILPDQAYDFIEPVPDGGVMHPSFLYHGSLALRGERCRSTLAALMEKHPCPVFLDVNLRDPWWKREDILPMIHKAAWLKLNDDEWSALFPDLPDHENGSMEVLERFNLEGVCITMGARGACARSRESGFFSMEPPSRVEVVDTVGAGDAFSSVLLMGILRGWPLSTTLERALEFAAGVVGQRGAIQEDENFYQSILAGWDT
ncbi:MAG: carbohydrate kinase [Desulfobulbaceae bacterium]